MGIRGTILKLHWSLIEKKDRKLNTTKNSNILND